MMCGGRREVQGAVQGVVSGGDADIYGGYRMRGCRMYARHNPTAVPYCVLIPAGKNAGIGPIGEGTRHTPPPGTTMVPSVVTPGSGGSHELFTTGGPAGYG